MKWNTIFYEFQPDWHPRDNGILLVLDKKKNLLRAQSKALNLP